MRFFIDRTFSDLWALCSAPWLETLGYRVEWSRNRYPRDPGDQLWLAELAAEADWILLTGDLRITSNPTIMRVWRSSGLTTFFFAAAWMSHRVEEQLWRLMRRWPQLLDHASTERAGSGLLVPFRFSPGRLPRHYSPVLPAR